MIDPVERGDTLPSRLPLSRLSFRWQITLLGTLVFVLFLAVLSATIGTLRYTKSAVLSAEKKQLSATTQNLAREYDDKAEFSRQNDEPPPLSTPAAASSREVLALLSRVVLQNIDGVSGGFYSKTGDTLLGYSFTNYEGLSKNENISVDEQQIILQVARNAAATHQPAEQVLSNGPGVFLVEAVPIRDGYSVVGSAWTTQAARWSSRIQPFSSLLDHRRARHLGAGQRPADTIGYSQLARGRSEDRGWTAES